jgi:hypothetical protein
MDALLYTSKQVKKSVTCYSQEDEKEIKEEHFQAHLLIASQRKRFNIREYEQIIAL